MDIDFLIERLERYILQDSPKILGNRAVNEEEVHHHLQQLRDSVPREIARAREIVKERESILKSAREEAERIVEEAHKESEEIISDHQAVIEARRQASQILKQARQEAEHLRSDADEYVFDALSQLQAELTRQLRVVENGLHRLEADRERMLAEGES